jgi:hypothetical protein
MRRSLALYGLAFLTIVACGGSESSSSTTTTSSDGGTSGTDAGASDASKDASTWDANVPCTDCLATPLTWGWNGGLVQYVDDSSVASCRTFARKRTSYFDAGTPPPSCTDELGACGAAPIAIGDIVRALAHPDVVAGFAAATTPLYGFDSRPSDGAVYRITSGNKSIEVGGDCPGGGTCVAIPAGVKALAKLLQDLDKQEIAKPACAAFQP